jgi:hypothetical protein
MAVSILLCVPEWGATTLCCRLKEHVVQLNEPLIIYEWHRILITKLEIGAAGADFSGRTSWWARENPKGPEHGNQ